MTSILFICHGNICRSTMCQFVMAELVRRAGREGEFVIDSAATSREELGNPPHHGTVRKLREVGIPVGSHRARQLRREEYATWDYIIYMDEENAWGLRRILGEDAAGSICDPAGKCAKLLSFAPQEAGCLRGHVRDVADPWYTGNFDETYRDVLAGCTGLLAALGAQDESLGKLEPSGRCHGSR